MQKQMIGQKLHPAIARFQPTMAAKLTAMLLEQDNSDLLLMLDDDNLLNRKVVEAMNVLLHLPPASLTSNQFAPPRSLPLGSHNETPGSGHDAMLKIVIL
jgi:hypothetical protein